ncbi:hypothetical protein E4U31_003624 [Claviceps sp. LM219 group G6]|nr:hypothetical protein E4U14_008518 [Claviceps sp. LM454 group G7]KAG6101599.1 hypothetical protein E4U31_003624 [Claviceps sp. LM219 group G6]
MQFLTFLLASASVGFAAASPAPQSSSVVPPPGMKPDWCNHGWSSNGICEKKGLNTYCCSYSKYGDFDVQRNVQGAPLSQFGNCLLFGLVSCA